MNVKTGIISDNTRPGFAKVFFPAENITTAFWPIISATTLKDKSTSPMAVNEHVVCVCDARCEEGFILGAIYSKADPVEDGAGAGKFRMKFEDGTVLEYDKTAHKLTADIHGQVDIKATQDVSVEGQTTVKATAVVSASIEAPLITLKGAVTVEGALTAGSLSLAAIGGEDGKAHGNLQVTGNVSADGDVSAGTVYLKTHVHTGVTTGAGVSGPPQL